MPLFSSCTACLTGLFEHTHTRMIICHWTIGETDGDGDGDGGAQRIQMIAVNCQSGMSFVTYPPKVCELLRRERWNLQSKSQCLVRSCAEVIIVVVPISS